MAVSCALIGVAISARLSGANINLSITLSNVLRKENKYRRQLLLVYFCAEMLGALLALIMGELLNDRALPDPIPY